MVSIGIWPRFCHNRGSDSTFGTSMVRTDSGGSWMLATSRAKTSAHTQDLPPTQSANEAKVYQLRTNRNPRATVYQFTDREITGLSQPPPPISAKNTYTANLPRFPFFSWKTTKIRSSQPSQKPFFRQLLFNNFNIYF